MGGIYFEQNAKGQLVKVEGVLEVVKQCSASLGKMSQAAIIVGDRDKFRGGECS